MNFIFNRFYSILIGFLLIIIGLFFPNQLIGIAICLILSLVVFYDEKVAVLFLIMTIPIRPFLIVYNPGFKFIGDILILVLLFKVIFDHRKDIRSLFRFNLLEIAFILFLAVGGISALITGVSIPAIVMQVRAFLLFFFLYYIVKRLEITNKDVRDFSLVTFITAIVLSIQGIVEKISVRTLLLPELWKNMDLAATNKSRVYGLIGGPNELGLFLLIAFFISMFLLSTVTRKTKPFIYIGMTLILCVFLLTYSRGAVLALGAFLVIYLLVNRKINHFKSIVVIALSATVLFFVVTKVTQIVEENRANQTETGPVAQKPNKEPEQPDSKTENGLNRFSGAFSKENVELSNADGRVYYVKKAVEVFKDRPIIGYGFATFGGAATQTFSSPIYQKYGIAWNFYSDNQYIQVLAETGMIGTALIVLFVFGLFKLTWALRRGLPFSPLLLFFLVGGITSGVVYNILENDVFMLYYFVILGYAYQYFDKRNKMNANNIQI